MQPIVICNNSPAFAEFERNDPGSVWLAECALKANGKRLGRLRLVFRRNEALRLRSEGMSWRGISKQLVCLFQR
jgi:hypothetical protein